MASVRGTMFYFADWLNDPELSLCSLAAQGLWARMFCYAGLSEARGYLLIGGKPASLQDLSTLVHQPVQEVEKLLTELEDRHVFSRDRRGVIYNRRLVRDEQIRRENSKNGRKGGNPNLSKTKEKSAPVNPTPPTPDKPISSLVLSLEEETHSKTESESDRPSVVTGHAQKPKQAVHPIPPNWQPTPEQVAFVVALGLDEFSVKRMAVAFAGYWSSGRGAGTKRSSKGWNQTWMTWAKREADNHRGSPSPSGYRPMVFEG